MVMSILFLVVGITTFTRSASAAEGPNELTNKLIVKFSSQPDPMNTFSYYDMPRKVSDALNMSYSLAASNEATNGTKTFCRDGDYRVCVLFDGKDSVAGLQFSVAVKEMQESSVAKLLDQDEYWLRQQVLGVDVYSAVTYFVNEDVLQGGGRNLQVLTPTAPEGVFFHSRARGRVHLKTDQSSAEDVGFKMQGCVNGMGLHYFQVDNQTKCEDFTPYFTLYSPNTQRLLAFGIQQFGTVSDGRPWFEKPPMEVILDKVAPYHPPCLRPWIQAYDIFSLHVFFTSAHHHIRC